MTLTDEEIRIKVAESLGWTDVWTTDYGALLGKHEPESMGRDYLDVPNYPESRDACSEFEATLTSLEFEKYRGILWDLCKRPQVTEWHRAYLSSTPRQRCLAYLKTKSQIP